jgi:hypothetical protein
MNKEKIRSKWASSGSSSEDGGEITHIRSKRRTKKHKAVVDAADTKQPINTAQVLVGPARPTIQDYEDISYYYADEVGGGVGEVDSQPVATTAQRSAALQPVYPSPQPCRGLPLRPCRHVAEFEKLNRISEGTYGVVYRVRDTQSGRIMALKRLKPANQVAGQQQQQPTLNTGFPLTSLREITTLLQCQHPNIVNMREVVTGDQPSEYVIAYNS